MVKSIKINITIVKLILKDLLLFDNYIKNDENNNENNKNILA
jgi:hypothetical protein